MSKLTVREEIVNALREGFGHAHITKVHITEDQTDVYVRGYIEPIRVVPDDVIIPDEYGQEIASMIALDVRAILAEL